MQIEWQDIRLRKIIRMICQERFITKVSIAPSINEKQTGTIIEKQN